MKQILLALFFISSLFGLDSSSKAEDYTAFEANLESHKSKCEAGDGKICRDIADFYFKKFADSYFNDRDSEAKSLIYNDKACEFKNGRGCFGMAAAYGERIGFDKSTPQDPIKELEYLNKGCDYNEPNSCDMLGRRYAKQAKSKSGADKKALELKAKKFYQKACDLDKNSPCIY